VLGGVLGGVIAGSVDAVLEGWSPAVGASADDVACRSVGPSGPGSCDAGDVPSAGTGC
jgi:hypothetical protein